MKTLSPGNYIGQNRRQYKLPGLTFTRCFFAKEFNSDWHRHEHSHLTLCLKGNSIEKRKKQDIPCSPGMLLLYPSDLLHRNTDYVSNSESFSIEFENAWCGKFEINNQQNCRHNIIIDPLVKMKIIAVMREVSQPDAQSNLCLEATVLDILHSLAGSTTNTARPPWITSLYELLHDEHNTHWTLTSLSEKLNIHPVTISKCFPRFFNTTLGEYIRKIKTQQSLGDLARKSIPLEQIALKYGFADNAHFTRVFKKHTGLTPSAYRHLVTG